MHEGAYACHYGEVDDQFAGAGIAPDAHVAQGERYGGRLGPHALLDACLRFIAAGIYHVHEVYGTVAVVVVVGEVGKSLVVCFLAGLTYHGRGVGVVAVLVVGTIVGSGIVERDGAYDIERGHKMPHRLGAEVVAGTAGNGGLQG